MAEQTTMVRVRKQARDLAEALAQGSVAAHSDALPVGTYSVSQGEVIERALEEYATNHPDLLPDKE